MCFLLLNYFDNNKWPRFIVRPLRIIQKAIKTASLKKSSKTPNPNILTCVILSLFPSQLSLSSYRGSAWVPMKMGSQWTNLPVLLPTWNTWSCPSFVSFCCCHSLDLGTAWHSGQTFLWKGIAVPLWSISNRAVLFSGTWEEALTSKMCRGNTLGFLESRGPAKRRHDALTSDRDERIDGKIHGAKYLLDLAVSKFRRNFLELFIVGWFRHSFILVQKLLVVGKYVGLFVPNKKLRKIHVGRMKTGQAIPTFVFRYHGQKLRYDVPTGVEFNVRG